jgi:DNA-binding NarL/FixJ family response regulator
MTHSNGRSSAATPEDEPIRVLIVDDHDQVLWGLKKLIEGEWPRMTVMGAAKSIKAALQVLASGLVDVAVLDLMLGDDDGLELLPAMRKSNVAVVVLTDSQSLASHQRALEHGARTVVLKAEPASVLLHEIERAHEWRKSPRIAAAREQDCHSAVKARIAGFLLSTSRR